MSDHVIQQKKVRIFNTPFESGLRSVILLTSCYPSPLNLFRLVVLDHLSVHSADIDGPPSLHPREESRAAEILVRRKLVQSGLALMGSRGLVERFPTPTGFRYQAGEEAGLFVDLLKSGYVKQLVERADWLRENVVPLDDVAFGDLVRARLDEWTAEFQSMEAVGG